MRVWPGHRLWYGDRRQRRLYNQNPDGAIDPTPTVAMAGLVEEERHVTTQWFKEDGDAMFFWAP